MIVVYNDWRDLRLLNDSLFERSLNCLLLEQLHGSVLGSQLVFFELQDLSLGKLQLVLEVVIFCLRLVIDRLHSLLLQP